MPNQDRDSERKEIQQAQYTLSFNEDPDEGRESSPGIKAEKHEPDQEPSREKDDED